jgi:hypothetical protein
MNPPGWWRYCPPPLKAPLHFLLVLTASGPLLAAGPGVPLEEGRSHRAFQPLREIAVPETASSDWARNEVDHFILAKLQSAGLQPSAEADRATLIRRVTLDLIGLLPAPDEVRDFVSDTSPAAYEALIDRLLDSPHYGERWGRHWLDLARYADTCGVHNDLDRPNAWKYRDYVIESFNQDKPYARFLAEQIAGDEMDVADQKRLIATGFCRNGPSNDDNMGKTPEALAQYRADQLDDVVATTSSVFLGLTVGCARCHDHKTEPLLAKDYYGMVAIFNGTKPLGLATDKKDKAQVMALVELGPKVPPTRLLLRGLAASPAEVVPASMPQVLTPAAVKFPAPNEKTSLRRRTLADWMAQQPLVWRVMVNRVWQHHFGVGLVATPSNFGLSGAKPSHPELLDFLAREFQSNGGKLKPLHKRLLLSATYRQQSKAHDQGIQRDPINTLLWRMNLQRMEAEVLRDSILTASGKLNPERGGAGFKPRIRAELLDASQRNKWPVLKSEGPEQWRRSVYIYVKRQLLMPSMELFDAPTTTDSCAVRTQSTLPTQALVMMNDEFVEEQAGHLAQRATKEAADDLSRAVDQLFLITLGRPPSETKHREALFFLKQRSAASDSTNAMKDLAHVLLNSSEFVTVE